MVVGDYWNERLENWARFYGVHRGKPLVSQMGSLMALSPCTDPEEEERERKESHQTLPVTSEAKEDADFVDKLLLHPRVNPIGRLFIVYVWGRRFTLGSFKRPKKEVVRVIRETIGTMESIEKNYDMLRVRFEGSPAPKTGI